MSNIGPPLYVITPPHTLNFINKLSNANKRKKENILPVFTTNHVNELEEYYQNEVLSLYSEQTNLDDTDTKRLLFLISDEHDEILQKLTNATYYYNNFEKLNNDSSVNIINKRLDIYYRFIMTYITDFSQNLDEIQVIFAPRYGGKKNKISSKISSKIRRTKKNHKNKNRNKKHKRKSYKN